jgi:hypothetical protein
MKTLLCAVAPIALSACVTTTSGPSAVRQVQIAELNHVFATVDPQTAEAIRRSEFVRRFANLEIRTTTGTRSTWTGRYLYGKQTYIEFFAPEDFYINDKPAPVGSWGIALSGDALGFNQLLKKRLEAAGHRALLELDTRKFGDRTVPWFEALTAISDHGDSGALGATASVWAMEYQPSYFELPEAAKESAEGPADVISRERYQSDVYAQRMMRDIVQVHFNVGPQDFARIEPLLKAAGYRITRSAGEVLAAGAQTDFRFTLTSPEAQRLREVRFSLNAPRERHVEAIGHSTLVVGPGATATWTFREAR